MLAYPEFTHDVAAQIDAFRAAHEPDRARMVAPHVTLVFALPDVEERTLSKWRDVTASTPAFSVSFAKARPEFDPHEGTHKLFLDCDAGSDELSRLHIALNEAAGASVVPSYQPHMTVATNRDADRIAALDLSELPPLPFYGQVKQLVAERLEDGMLTTLAQLPLGHAAS
ncbi:MAG: 2'-5' RNA ligase family protein [Paracoccaceae bacterium]